jgi:hypothetical protein
MDTRGYREGFQDLWSRGEKCSEYPAWKGVSVQKLRRRLHTQRRQTKSRWALQRLLQVRTRGKGDVRGHWGVLSHTPLPQKCAESHPITPEVCHVQRPGPKGKGEVIKTTACAPLLEAWR